MLDDQTQLEALGTLLLLSMPAQIQCRGRVTLLAAFACCAVSIYNAINRRQ
jgi:hypothetical protein